MTPDYARLMTEATRLTRAGDLTGATAAIQAALAGRALSTPSTHDDVIDVPARVVPDAAPAPAHASDTLFSIAPGAGTTSAGGKKQPESSPADATAAAARTLTGHHAHPRAGGRDYTLFIPPGPATAPRPLVVMLHGCTQTPADFAAGTRMNEAAAAHGFAVLYPAQSRQMNPQRCWNWFKHSHQQRERGEPAIIAGMVRAVVAEHGLDPTRVYVAGLSAGGAMAAVLGQAYPDVFAAIGVHSGLASGAATDLPSALAAMQGGARGRAGVRPVPTIVFHGDQDATVHPANGAHVAASAAAPGSTAQVERLSPAARRSSTRHVHRAADGASQVEHWVVHGAPHAWSGGSAAGSYTDPSGPDATAEMLRFFKQHRLPG